MSETEDLDFLKQKIKRRMQLINEQIHLLIRKDSMDYNKNSYNDGYHDGEIASLQWTLKQLYKEN